MPRGRIHVRDNPYVDNGIKHSILQAGIHMQLAERLTSNAKQWTN